MSKVHPQPSGGHLIHIKEEHAQEHNLRILSCCYEQDVKPIAKGWFLPSEETLPLLFFRRIFTGLREQQKQQEDERRALQAMIEEPRTDSQTLPQYQDANTSLQSEEGDKDDDENVPIEAFQRAFERLFYILGDEDGFDANAEGADENGDGTVGWSEFSKLYNSNRDFTIKLSLPERIYLTFENPESSYSAQVVSTLVLLTIVVSSICFILGTSEDFQKEPVGNNKPEPEDSLASVELVCLWIFVVEYIFRICTCWAVRAEVADKEKLLSLSLGSGPLHVMTPSQRLLFFCIAPSNVIDLVAVVPGVISFIISKVSPNEKNALEGGAFTVLRLVRLTRIFRAFKHPKLVEAVIVLRRTMYNSDKAMYLLGFQGVLGILITGSLIYLVEKGDWNPDTRSYHRFVGTEYSSLGMDTESPFLSIPHSFWWAVVTSTTVGYGDHFPTSSMGYVIAVLTMVLSSVIAALPIGVIGSNFEQVWKELVDEKKANAKQMARDQRFITSAKQKINPMEMSKLLYIEVWNQRLSGLKEFTEDAETITKMSKEEMEKKTPEELEKLEKKREMMQEMLDCRPHVSEFLGQAHLKLDLDPRKKFKSEKLTLPLQQGAEGDLPKRKCTGTIDLQYEWDPTQGDKLDASRINGEEQKNLHGQLKVTLLSAQGLVNLTYRQGMKSASNPYCRVFCYPRSPSKGSPLCPSAWRSPHKVDTLSPEWNAVYTVNFSWTARTEGDKCEDAADQSFTGSKNLTSRYSIREEGTFAGLPRSGSKKNVVFGLKDKLDEELKILTKELRDLNNRITRFSLTSAPPAV